MKEVQGGKDDSEEETLIIWNKLRPSIEDPWIGVEIATETFGVCLFSRCEKLLVIIFMDLDSEQKKKHLEVLKRRKGDIAQKILDIKCISLTYCTHKILMEKFKSVIQPQR